MLAIVAGCFAVLWPKIFVPMLFGAPPGAASTDDEGEGGRGRVVRCGVVYGEGWGRGLVLGNMM